MDTRLPPNSLPPWTALQWTISSPIPVLVSFAATIKANQNTSVALQPQSFLSRSRHTFQLLATGSFLFHVSSLQHPGSRNSPYLGQVLLAEKNRARELEDTNNCIWSFCSNWRTEFPLLFHWPKQVTGPSLSVPPHPPTPGWEVQHCTENHLDMGGSPFMGKGEQIIANNNKI